MRGAERVVFALGALGEAGQAIAHPQGADAVAAAGENLVRIGLMADVPDDPVPRGVEHVVQGDRELDHAETGAEVPAGDGDRIDRLGTQFVGDLPELALFEPPEVVRGCGSDRGGASWTVWTPNNLRQTIETTELPGAAGAPRSPSHKGP